MGPENFEDHIRSTFEGQTKKAPQTVWSGVESSLNASLVASYQASHQKYKWLSIAALLVAVMSFAFFFTETQQAEETPSGESYNALLSSNRDQSGLYSTPFNGSQTLLVPLTIVLEKQSSSSVPDQTNQIPLVAAEKQEEINVLVPRTFSIALADVKNDIYRYQKAGYYSTPKSSDTEKPKVWAGVEAGAGNFNTSLDGGDDISGGINSLGLANAIGTEGFVNPTTVVNPQINDGLATTVGLDFGVKIGSRWTIESGVAYTNVDARGSASINVLDVYTIDNGDFTGSDIDFDSNSPIFPNSSSREAPLEIQESYDHDIDLKNNIQFTSIPVKAGYFVFDKKMSLRINAGLAANYFVSSQLNDPSQGIINSTQNDLYNEWSFDGIGGLELGYSLFNKFDLTLEPNYRYAITPISDFQNSPSRFVIQTGLRYTLK